MLFNGVYFFVAIFDLVFVAATIEIEYFVEVFLF